MDNAERFEFALNVLTPRIAELFSALGKEQKSEIREIRLRTGKPLISVDGDGI